MTREEFDKWIGRNRKRLIRVAWATVGKVDAEDAVQDMLLWAYVHKVWTRVRHERNLVAYFAKNVRAYAHVIRRSRRRAEMATAELKILSGAGSLRSGRKPSMDQQENPR